MKRLRAPSPVWLPALYLAGVGAFGILVGSWAWRDHFTMLYGNDWGILHRYYSMPLGEWLFSPAAGHRLPVTLLLLAADLELLSGRMHLLVVASLVTTLATVWILRTGLRASDPEGTPLAWVAYGFACFCLLWSGGSFNFLWGLNQGSTLATFWLLLALSLLARYHAQGRINRALPAGAAVAAALATYSQGMGFGTWASILAIAIVGRFGWRVLACFALAAAVTIGLFTIGLSERESSVGGLLEFLVGRPVRALTFVAAFVGSAPARVWTAWGVAPESLHASSVLAGAAGLLGALAYGLLLLGRRSPARPRELFAVGLLVFAPVGAIVVARLRLPFGPEQAVAQRFVCWSVLFWIGVVWALLSFALEKAWSPRKIAVGTLATAVLSMSMLPAMDDMRNLHEQRRRYLRTVRVALWLGLMRAPFILGATGTRTQRLALDVYPVAERLREAGKSLYADPRHELPGTVLAERFEVGTGCRGSWRTDRTFSLDGRLNLIARGRAWDETRGAPAGLVLLTDGSGTIRGLGTMGAILRRKTPVPEDPSTWLGLVADVSEPKRYSAYAVIDDGAVACRLSRRERGRRGSGPGR